MSSKYCTQITTGQFMKAAMVGKPAKAEEIADWKKELNHDRFLYSQKGQK